VPSDVIAGSEVQKNRRNQSCKVILRQSSKVTEEEQENCQQSRSPVRDSNRLPPKHDTCVLWPLQSAQKKKKVHEVSATQGEIRKFHRLFEFSKHSGTSERYVYGVCSVLQCLPTFHTLISPAST